MGLSIAPQYENARDAVAGYVANRLGISVYPGRERFFSLWMEVGGFDGHPEGVAGALVQPLKMKDGVRRAAYVALPGMHVGITGEGQAYHIGNERLSEDDADLGRMEDMMVTAIAKLDAFMKEHGLEAMEP